MRSRFGLWLTSPALVLLILQFLAPILYGIWLSLHEARFGLIQPGLTLNQYQTIFNNSGYVSALTRSLRLAGTATFIALIVGYTVAYALAFKMRRFVGVFMIVLIAPLLMNVVIRTMGWVLILGRNGLINDTLRSWGFGEIPLLANPMRMSATPIRYEMPPPLLGEHTDEVLMQLLGRTADEVAALRRQGVL